MFRWCSYCQQFQGEAPPYADLAITHGICPLCLPRAWQMGADDLQWAHQLRAIQDRLAAAGRAGDMAAAEDIVALAVAARLRGIDVLLGMVAPVLYRIGADWQCGAISVADEHRCTAFCERVFRLVADRIPASAANPEIVVANAPGNHHTLGVRMLELWLRDRGHTPMFLDPILAAAEWIALVERLRPRALLVSISLPDQFDAVAGLARHLHLLPEADRPRLFLGGYACKTGLLPPLPGAACVEDVCGLGRLGF